MNIEQQLLRMGHTQRRILRLMAFNDCWIVRATYTGGEMQRYIDLRDEDGNTYTFLSQDQLNRLAQRGIFEMKDMPGCQQIEHIHIWLKPDVKAYIQSRWTRDGLPSEAMAA